MLAFHTTLAQVLVLQIATQFPIVPGKVVEDGPSIWALYPGCSVPCLWPVPALVLVAIWGANQHIQDLSMSLNFYVILYVTLSYN